jgi:hypothetical protein
MTQQFEGVLEIDNSRGVIYFHSAKTGASVLRICRLGEIPELKDRGSIDITHMYGVTVVEGDNV